MDTEMKEIVGQSLVAIKTCGEYLWLETYDGVHKYRAENDCCNRVWFSWIAGFSQSGQVESVMFADWQSEDDESKHHAECTEGHEEYCAYVIKQIGRNKPIVIEIRNNHNGYYGGRLDYCGFIPNK